MAPDAAPPARPQQGAGQIFSRDTQAIFYNFKPAAQRMLDADYLFGGREERGGVEVMARLSAPRPIAAPARASERPHRPAHESCALTGDCWAGSGALAAREGGRIEGQGAPRPAPTAPPPPRP